MITITKSIIFPVLFLLINISHAQQNQNIESSAVDSKALEKLICVRANASFNQHGNINAVVIKVLRIKIASLETDCKEPEQLVIEKSEINYLRKNYFIAFQELECMAGNGICSKVKRSVSPSWKSILTNIDRLRLRSFFVLGSDANPKIMFSFSYDKTYPTHSMILLYKNNKLQEVKFGEVYID
jgi:hypothetical protein